MEGTEGSRVSVDVNDAEAGDAVPGGATIDDSAASIRQSRDFAESTPRVGAVVEAEG
ncbi:hypothetical protein [Pseudonocardia yuanmonensis]|jgi:hypothetical protein